MKTEALQESETVYPFTWREPPQCTIGEFQGLDISDVADMLAFKLHFNLAEVCLKLRDFKSTHDHIDTAVDMSEDRWYRHRRPWSPKAAKEQAKLYSCRASVLRHIGDIKDAVECMEKVYAFPMISPSRLFGREFLTHLVIGEPTLPFLIELQSSSVDLSEKWLTEKI